MNRFKNPVLRDEYDNAVHQFETRHRNLFLLDGTPKKGGSPIAEFFWKGYYGLVIGMGFTDRASREIIGYAHYRAGQDMAKRQKETK